MLCWSVIIGSADSNHEVTRLNCGVPGCMLCLFKIVTNLPVVKKFFVRVVKCMYNDCTIIVKKIDVYIFATFCFGGIITF